MGTSFTFRTWRWIEFVLFWCVLQSMLFWPTSFYGFRSIFNLIAAFLIILSYKRIFNRITNATFLIFLTALIISDSIFLDGLKTTLAVSSSYILGTLMFCMKDNYKASLLQDTTKWLSYILAPGIVVYVLWIIFQFPGFGVLSKPYGYSDHYNYIFFIRPVAFMLVPRFSGPFMEPGHLGMIGVFFLYANRFDFKHKKHLWILLISVLLSLSLAGYVLLFFAILFDSKVSLKRLLSCSFIFLILYVFVTEIWNNGDNPINSTIFERLEYDEEKGISGNNRNFNYTEIYFSKMCDDMSIVWGIGFDGFMKGMDEGKIGGAGLMVFLMQYGIIGTLLVIAYYLSIAMSGFDKKFAIGFFGLIIICFLQRAYPTWIAWLLPYISSISLSKRLHNDAI